MAHFPAHPITNYCDLGLQDGRCHPVEVVGGWGVEACPSFTSGPGEAERSSEVHALR